MQRTSIYLLLLIVGCSVFGENSEIHSKWEFFPYCTSHHDPVKRTLDEQATLFHELGFSGFGHLSQELGFATNLGHPRGATVKQRAVSLERHNLRLYIVYAFIDLNASQPINHD
ncbi:MAG: hypothetical protein ACI8W8_003054 [Rhodothermales bacterium]|jgi:hypothetical protein